MPASCITWMTWELQVLVLLLGVLVLKLLVAFHHLSVVDILLYNHLILR